MVYLTDTGNGSELMVQKKRSGYFNKGIPVGEWITYDKKGHVYKITQKD